MRPSSGAASTGCSDASDSIGARSRSDIAAPEDAGALRRGDPPPSLTQYRAAAHPRGGPDLVLRPVWLAKAGFGQINVALDVTQHFVIDDPLVAQLQNGLALDLQGLLRKLLVLG